MNNNEVILRAIEPEDLDRILQGLAEACDDLDMDAMETAKEELKKKIKQLEECLQQIGVQSFYDSHVCVPY